MPRSGLPVKRPQEIAVQSQTETSPAAVGNASLNILVKAYKLSAILKFGLTDESKTFGIGASFQVSHSGTLTGRDGMPLSPGNKRSQKFVTY